MPDVRKSFKSNPSQTGLDHAYVLDTARNSLPISKRELLNMRKSFWIGVVVLLGVIGVSNAFIKIAGHVDVNFRLKGKSVSGPPMDLN